VQLLYHPASTLSTPHRQALGYSHPPRLPMSSEDFRRLRTGHASCGRLSRVRVWALFTVPIVAVTACIAITKNEKSFYVAAVVKPSCVFFFPAFSGRCVTSPRAVERLPWALAPRASNDLLQPTFCAAQLPADGLNGISSEGALHGVLTAQLQG